ncbi:MAG: porin [Bacteroidaceae bacterium]|jgi:hypothetical protein|nr:porin [Bacteroidaceae bacterium]
MKRVFLMLVVAMCAVCAIAQTRGNDEYADENVVVNVHAQVRADFMQDYWDGNLNKPTSGFKGKYLNLILDGHINKHFYYSYRQRLNRAPKTESFFDATDWVYLSYRPNKHWDISAGKQVVGIGGFEYDRAPIDLYFCSEYWNNIACYQFGASVAYIVGDGSDRIMAQVCESPFNRGHQDYLFAYNVMWHGNHDWFKSIYSFNASEYVAGKYIYYLVLGNEFTFDNFRLQVDFMNRATNEHAFFFKDFSVMGELSYMIKDKVNIYGKVSYDINDSGVEGDYCVMPGTELTRVGGGAEYYPLSKGRKDLRLFAYYCYTWGVNGNPAGGALQDKQNMWAVGLKWDIDIFSLTNKIFKKNEKAEN